MSEAQIVTGLATWFGAAMTDGLLLVLIGVAVIGLRGLDRLAGGEPRSARRSLGEKLVTWRAAAAGGEADLARQIGAYYRSLAATTSAVTGLVLVLAGLALGLLAWSGHPASSLGSEEGGLIWWTAWLIQVAQVAGIGLGYPLAVRLAHRSLPAGPRYADLRRRRLDDYRAPGLRWLARVGVAMQAVAGAALVLLLNRWTPLVMPALAALSLAAAELHLWATARVPRMVVTADPATARRCDDLVRATVIARLQQAALLSPAIAALVGALVIAGMQYPRTLPGARIALAVFALSAMYCALCALVIGPFEERLGGRITGWWGRPMPE
jgi:hypothetical protein